MWRCQMTHRILYLRPRRQRTGEGLARRTPGTRGVLIVKLVLLLHQPTKHRWKGSLLPRRNGHAPPGVPGEMQGERMIQGESHLPALKQGVRLLEGTRRDRTETGRSSHHGATSLARTLATGILPSRPRILLRGANRARDRIRPLSGNGTQNRGGPRASTGPGNTTSAAGAE